MSKALASEPTTLVGVYANRRDDITKVSVALDLPSGEQIVATGVAKKNPMDLEDPVLGYYVALAKALAKMQSTVERVSLGLMQNHDRQLQKIIKQFNASRFAVPRGNTVEL